MSIYGRRKFIDRRGNAVKITRWRSRRKHETGKKVVVRNKRTGKWKSITTRRQINWRR